MKKTENKMVFITGGLSGIGRGAMGSVKDDSLFISGTALEIDGDYLAQ